MNRLLITLPQYHQYALLFRKKHICVYREGIVSQKHTEERLLGVGLKSGTITNTITLVAREKKKLVYLNIGCNSSVRVISVYKQCVD